MPGYRTIVFDLTKANEAQQVFASREMAPFSALRY